MSIYREYDIRGIYGEDLDAETIKRIGYALSREISGHYVAVGYDARSHSPDIFEYLAEGLNMGGKCVLDMGMVPTPVNYFANYCHFDLCGEDVVPDASVMITGSHNPPEYNGLKITVDRRPFFADRIYELGRVADSVELPEEVEKMVERVDVITPYIEYMIEEFGHLRGMDCSVVYDCGNGTAGIVLPEIFERVGIDAQGIYVEPDGNFPNHHPDPSVKENLIDIESLLHDSGADIAFAYDGDADRLAVITRRRNIKGDQMALLFSMKMRDPTVVGEVKCSQVMYDTLAARGAKAVMHKTGHSNLKVKIRELDADLACEVSGHIFFNDRYYGYDDAIYATLRMLELIRDGIDPDDELDKIPSLYSTDEIKIETTDRDKFLLMDRLKEMLKDPPADFPAVREVIDIDGVRVVFDKGWGLMRASNTTPSIVSRFEAETREDMRRYSSAMRELLLKAEMSIGAERDEKSHK